MLSLLPDDHPLLFETMPIFCFETDDAQSLASTLLEAMIYYDGAGLAANQIGIRSKAFAMLDGGEPKVMFNPLVMWMSEETCFMEEGCLSFPDLELKIARPARCTVSYDDLDGISKTVTLNGRECRIALHEIDHLEGIVFTKRVSRLKLNMAKKKLKKRA